MQLNFQDVKLSDNLVILTDGQEVVERIDEILENIKRGHDSSQKKVWPIPLLLLDVNMPILNGLETLIIVKEKYR